MLKKQYQQKLRRDRTLHYRRNICNVQEVRRKEQTKKILSQKRDS